MSKERQQPLIVKPYQYMSWLKFQAEGAIRKVERYRDIYERFDMPKAKEYWKPKLDEAVVEYHDILSEANLTVRSGV